MVTPYDSVTGEYIGDRTTMVQAATGFADSATLDLPPGFDLDYPLWVESAEERAGTYLVTVRRPGYATWERANVRVKMASPCGVQTVMLYPRLQPLP